MTTTALFTSVFMLILCGLVTPQNCERGFLSFVRVVFAVVFLFTSILFAIVFFAMWVDNVVELVKDVCNIVYHYVV